jgi:hypothetical protein
MGRKRLVSKKDIDARYWRNVEIQDCFWRDSFIGFIRPLRTPYRHPMSAGAHILSAYLADPINAKLEFTGSPDAFGALRDEADLARAKDTYEELVTGRSGPRYKGALNSSRSSGKRARRSRNSPMSIRSSIGNFKMREPCERTCG